MPSLLAFLSASVFAIDAQQARDLTAFVQRFRDLIQYAFVGSTINIAARVQDLTRLHDADILATGAVAEALDPRFALRALPPAELRGVREPVAVFAVEAEGAAAS